MNLQTQGSYEVDPVSPKLRALYVENNMTTLWEAPNRFGSLEEKPHHWAWNTVRDIMMETAKITSPSIIERRVLNFVNPSISDNPYEVAHRLMNVGVQAMMPGETARPHRHSMHALRFVLEGEGAETVVEGKPCLMEPGDLITTPGWTWHEHRNIAGTPTIWVDILDLAVQAGMGVAQFQPGPPLLTEVMPDAAYAQGGFLPVGHDAAIHDRTCSPMFRYPLKQARIAVENAPRGKDGSQKIRYCNPSNGGPVLPTIDCYLQKIDSRFDSMPTNTNSSSVIVVIEGSGETRIGDDVISWQPNDVFTIPQNQSVTHNVRGGHALIFSASNRLLFENLGMLKDQS